MVPIEDVEHGSGADASDGSEGGLGVEFIIAAVLLGISVVMASMVLTAGMDRNGVLLATALRKTELALGQANAAAVRRAPVPEVDIATKHTLNTVGSPFLGPASAKVTLVEFSDFQCPFCARATPTLRKIRKAYGDDVRIVFKHLPLPIHPKAPAAHLAAEAAHRQGKFWPLHDKIFAEQGSMSEENYLKWAAELGLDMEQFARDVASSETKTRVASDAREAHDLGVSSTPAFFVNGYLIKGAKPFSVFQEKIDEELAK